jgi:hypothetical protein
VRVQVACCWLRWVTLEPLRRPVRRVWLSRPGARCRGCSWSVSTGRSPNPPCRSPGNGLSTVSAVQAWLCHGPGAGDLAAVGGVLTGGTAGYVRIRQQPTALQETPDPRLAALESDLTGRGFAVQRVADMDGWLACQAMFVACITAALYRCGTDPVRLAADRATLTLMCRAITEAFAALRASSTAGPPRNLAVLHSPLLREVAVRYWARTIRSPMGELCFAAHARHAEAEMRALARDVLARTTGSPALTELLA